jgi:hypothetical protein
MQQKPVAATLASWLKLGCSTDVRAFFSQLQLYLQLGKKLVAITLASGAITEDRL